MLRSIRDFENFHILLWLIKDTCWLLEFHAAGVISIIPTVGFAIYITVRRRKIVKELVHNIAVCLWILANSTWMIGEFFYNDSTRPIALWFFLSGLILVAAYHSGRLVQSLRDAGQNGKWKASHGKRANQ